MPGFLFIFGKVFYLTGYVTLVFQRSKVPFPSPGPSFSQRDMRYHPWVVAFPRTKGLELAPVIGSWLRKERSRSRETEGPQIQWEGVVCVKGAEGVCGWVWAVCVKCGGVGASDRREARVISLGSHPSLSLYTPGLL